MKIAWKSFRGICLQLGVVFLLLAAPTAYADVRTLGDVASEILKSFTNISKLITAASTLAGLGFTISAVMKFKQHKDNPTQVTIGAPIALLFIGALLLFLPSVISETSYTLFGPQGGKSAGPSGIIITK